MNNNNFTDTDTLMCKAFKEIVALPASEIEQKLGSEARVSIANYLNNLPAQDFQNPNVMANHISVFCLSPENKNLRDWWREIYYRLNKDGINKIVKKSLDPGEEADDEPETQNLISNEGRDICLYLERWAQEVKNQDNQSQDNQGNKDGSNSK
ncbi:MAG TPA: hypothetical protein V6D25_14995 [Leptolyngbyaceae cyanobacterium]